MRGTPYLVAPGTCLRALAEPPPRQLARDSIGRLEHAITEMAAAAHCDRWPMFIPQDEFSAWAWLPLGVRRDVTVSALSIKSVRALIRSGSPSGNPRPGSRVSAALISRR